MDVDISQAYRLSNGIELPAFDPREATAFTLPSGLKVLVLSDSHAESAACSVEIGVGHFSDPAELPGLAHFLEHMLFMGTIQGESGLGLASRRPLCLLSPSLLPSLFVCRPRRELLLRLPL